MTTKTELFAQLEKMNAPRDSVVLMHTSLRAVGETEGRGEGLLEVLIDYFTGEGGLFCVPTHTWSNIGAKAPITMDMSCYETCIGTLPNIAAAHLAAHRSAHPSHSMAVFGEDEKAEAFIADEAFVRTPCSVKGCYGKLYDMGGKILLVGVGQDNNTYLHSAEERLDVPGRVSKEVVPMTVRLKNGELLCGMHHHHEGNPSAYFHKMEPAFRAHGLITDGFVGKAPSTLCDARGMYEVLKKVWENAGRRDLFADDEPLAEEWYR